MILLNTKQKEVTQQKAAMTIGYGKKIYMVILRFTEKGKATMNDKALKLIRPILFVNRQRKGVFKYPE